MPSLGVPEQWDQGSASQGPRGLQLGYKPKGLTPVLHLSMGVTDRSRHSTSKAWSLPPQSSPAPRLARAPPVVYSMRLGPQLPSFLLF